MSGLHRPACKQDHERNLRRINRNARNLKVSRSHVQNPTKTPKASSLRPNIRTNPYFDVNLTLERENYNLTQHPPTPKHSGTLKCFPSLSNKFKELISPTLTKLHKRVGKSSVSSDESSEKSAEEEIPLESMVGDSSGNPNKDLYSCPSMDLPTYPLVYPLELDTQNPDATQNIKNDLEQQHRLVIAKLKNIVEAKNPQSKVQTTKTIILEPTTLEISTGQVILETPLIDIPFDILGILDKLGPFPIDNIKEIINVEDSTNSPPIRTVRGSTSDSRKSKSTKSSSSSSSEDTRKKSDRRLNRDLGEENAGLLDPSDSPNPPNLPPLLPLPIDITPIEVNPMANPNRPLNIAAYPIFYQLPRTDLNMHVSRFLAICSVHRVLNQDYLRTFPTTLDGVVFSWYQRQPDFFDWDALKNAFIAQYRPLGFRKSLMNN